ncbi:hypothetical protein B296_00027090 [Ensete ventricosum]|uniref:Uncharacterized protein n=1 Tax=Ensete ventricosum TaxID=4639 RepID=A0A427APF9_ENSVE|nr:hypothetical protein B296_00027090 [Ensete ventricosum]
MATELVGRDAAAVEEGDQAASVNAKGDGRRERERERGKEKARGRHGVVHLEAGQQDGASRTFAPVVAGGLQVQTHSQAVVAAHEECDNEQDEREDGYSSRADEAQSGAPIGKRCHKERLTTGETRLDVLEASFPLRLMKAPRVTSSQEEAESRIDKVESLVNRLTEDTKDSVQHLHEVVEELMSKRERRKRGGVVCLEVGQVRGRVMELARRDAGSVEEGDQVAGVDAEGDGKSRRERERERERGNEKARGWDGVVHLEAGQVHGRAAKLVERDTTVAEEGYQATSVNTEGDGEDRRGPRFWTGLIPCLTAAWGSRVLTTGYRCHASQSRE